MVEPGADITTRIFDQRTLFNHDGASAPDAPLYPYRIAPAACMGRSRSSLLPLSRIHRLRFALLLVVHGSAAELKSYAHFLSRCSSLV